MSFWDRLKRRLVKYGGKAPPVDTEQTALGLTAREKDVLELLLEGYTLKETAELLGVKASTVNTHTTSIYKKLSVSSRAELIIRYRNYEKENTK